jgi:glycosyltransferase involved in cell wall biosynthesis
MHQSGRSKKTDLAIVNRSFWPKSQVIGEGLLQFAELVAKQYSVCVITQEEGNLEALLAGKGRGRGVQVRACKAYTTSASGLIKRIAEAVFFMLWTFVSLVRAKPANVYVSTNPPVVVPFVVALYCRLFNANYVYHLQDIHPEAANIVVPLNGAVFRLLKRVDNYTLRHATAIITLSEDMKAYIQQRSGTHSPIYLLDNPSFEVTPLPVAQRTKDIVFCGNAGRLQRIPLLMTAIREYLQRGGNLRFTFAGGGVHTPDVKALADAYEQVDYLGFIPATEAAELVNQHRWALLPIDDEVTNYAFPSKSSSYVKSGCALVAVCSKETSVARWVFDNKLGITFEPDRQSLIDGFFKLETEESDQYQGSKELLSLLDIDSFSTKLFDILMVRT